MRPATANAPAAERPASDLLAGFAAHLGLTGRGNRASTQGARSFLRRWPRPQAWADQPLEARLAAGPATTPFLMFLMVHRLLQPGWDWLVARKLASFWREIGGSPLEADMARFLRAAESIGFTPIQAYRVASQSVGRVLIQTRRPLEDLTIAHLDELAEACRQREASTGKDWGHYRSAINAAHRVLFHLGGADSPPASWLGPRSLEDRVADAPGAVRSRFVAYLERKTGTCRPKTVSSLATRLSHFGRFLAEIDPALPSLSALDRCRHIEPYLNSVAAAVSAKTGEPITIADQARRVLAVASFLRDISDWGWPHAPARRLVFPADLPRLPQPLPRYLPVDADRRLTEALVVSTGLPPTRSCWHVPAGCASESCWTSSSTASTRSTATGRG